MQLDLNLPRHMIDQLDQLSGDAPLRSYIRKILQDHISGSGATVSNTDTGINNDENTNQSTGLSRSSQG